MVKVLITGGAGYIGSTIASACADAGITPIVLDSLVSGCRDLVGGHAFYEGDIADGTLLDQVFRDHPEIGATVHCAALLTVAESVRQPLRYHLENVVKTVELVDHLLRNGCTRFLFSSSAAVYAGNGGEVDESSPVDGRSPYARTKAFGESALRNIASVSPMRCIALRYFNPIGADPMMRSGMPGTRPAHVLGRLGEAYHAGRPFQVYGTGWPTRDGSAVRDYIHVWDLARAHVAALRRFDLILRRDGERSYDVINLGSGRGTTVRELIAEFQVVTGAAIAVRESGDRPGDTVGCYTRGTKARALLGWQPSLSIADGIRHHLMWTEQMRVRSRC